MAYTPIQPDSGSQTGTPYKAAIEGSIGAMSRLALPFAPYEQASPNMTLRLFAGALLINNNLVEIAGQNTGVFTAPATHLRIDRVVINALTGTSSIINGIEASSPSPPAITGGYLPICQVHLSPSTTAITNNLITDERVGGGGSGQAFPINSIYQNKGTNPVSELLYGTWNYDFLPMSTFPITYPIPSDTYVKATSFYNSHYKPYFATDPTLSLTGPQSDNCWASLNQAPQRFHIDSGYAQILRGLYIENFHDSGTKTNQGANNFTLLGSNDPGAFAESDYAIDTNWTLISTDISHLYQHAAIDAPDPQFVRAFPGATYRYYCLKCADSWGGGYINLRRLGLQFGPISWLRTA